MPFELPKLPYEYKALEPFMDSKTVEIHHDKHHAAYTNKLNTALEKYPLPVETSIEEILCDLSKIPEEVRSAVRNNGGGYYHHNLWWAQLTPNAEPLPIGKIAEAIQATFGDFVTFQAEMNKAALNQFGSGWAWLSKKSDNTLVVHATPNQDSPISAGLYPLLTIDVWEHAYYLKYQNRRDEFVTSFWKMVNWSEVETRYTSGKLS